jgi:uncharacterized membrane protein YcaP (DUF421 family)
VNEIFGLRVPAWELILRGSAIYWFLFALFRFLLRRHAGSLGVADILLVSLVSEAAQNGMSGTYQSIGEGVVLISTIAAWSFLIDKLAFHFDWFERFAEPRALLLIEDGRPLAANLRKASLSEPELLSQLRQNGVERIEAVKAARLEPDGHISVICAPKT